MLSSSHHTRVCSPCPVPSSSCTVSLQIEQVKTVFNNHPTITLATGIVEGVTAVDAE